MKQKPNLFFFFNIYLEVRSFQTKFEAVCFDSSSMQYSKSEVVE